MKAFTGRRGALAREITVSDLWFYLLQERATIPSLAAVLSSHNWLLFCSSESGQHYVLLLSLSCKSWSQLCAVSLLMRVSNVQDRITKCWTIFKIRDRLLCFHLEITLNLLYTSTVSKILLFLVWWSGFSEIWLYLSLAGEDIQEFASVFLTYTEFSQTNVQVNPVSQTQLEEASKYFANVNWTDANDVNKSPTPSSDSIGNGQYCNLRYVHSTWPTCLYIYMYMYIHVHVDHTCIHWIAFNYIG